MAGTTCISAVRDPAPIRQGLAQLPPVTTPACCAFRRMAGNRICISEHTIHRHGNSVELRPAWLSERRETVALIIGTGLLAFLLPALGLAG